MAVSAVAGAFAVSLYPSHHHTNQKPTVSKETLALDDESSFGFKDFPPHYPIRRVHNAASRNYARKSLHSHRTEPKPKPTPADIPTPGTTRALGHAMMLEEGWNESQWPCLDELWTRESNWRVSAANSSGAYGIPQSLPGSKMEQFGNDWQTNAVTQIKWGLWYIRYGRPYGTPCSALQHSFDYGWY